MKAISWQPPIRTRVVDCTWQLAQFTACLKSSQIVVIQLSADSAWAAVRDARGARVASRTASLMMINWCQ